MAAGGLSYSGLVNHGKVTLPSVETWGSNMNILRDPPKSITTRRVNKVGETSSITQTIEESENRSCEAIQVYARGVNPSVSVSYTNHGNNGGQRSGSIVSNIHQSSAKLPYTIMRDGAFRPPVKRQEDLMPLSRLPRTVTKVDPTAYFADYTKTALYCKSAKETKEVKDILLKSQVRPTAVYNIERPLAEPFEVKNVIQPAMHIGANAGYHAKDILQHDGGVPTKEIMIDPMHMNASANQSKNIHVDSSTMQTDRYLQDVYNQYVNVNKSDPRNIVNNTEMDPNRFLQEVQYQHVNPNKSDTKYINNSEVETTRYLQDACLGSAEVNKSSKVGHTTILDDIVDLGNIPVFDNIASYSVDVNKKGGEKVDYIHKLRELEKVLPEYDVYTSKTDNNKHVSVEHENELVFDRNIPMNSFASNPNGRKSSDIVVQEYARLADKLQFGGFDNMGNLPAQTQHLDMTANGERARVNKFVSESMMDRFGSKAPF